MVREINQLGLSRLELVAALIEDSIGYLMPTIAESHISRREKGDAVCHCERCNFVFEGNLEECLSNFFDNGIVQICEALANSGKRVIVAGLTLDFRGEPFGDHILALLAKADELDRLTAICVVCGGPATRTQRLVAGKPAEWSDPIYMEGGEDVYQAVCRKHHQIKRPLLDQRLQYHVLPKPSAAQQ